MLKSYFKIALRNILRNRISTIINVAGLSIGLCSCILIFLYVQNELSYDKSWPGHDKIYRINTRFKIGGQRDDYFAYSAFALVAGLREQPVSYATFTQLMPLGKQTVWYEDKVFNEENMYYADSSLFRVFEYNLVKGNPAKALSEPKTVVISEDLAKRYFGSADPIGKQLKFTKNKFTVTGVFRQGDEPRHLKSEAFLSLLTLDTAVAHAMKNDWFRMSLYSYFRLKDKYEAKDVLRQLVSIRNDRIIPFIRENQLNDELNFVIEPVTDIHFDRDVTYDPSPKGNRAYVYIFSIVAIFILVIACINYMNMATARAAKRSREVGVRKVLGASRGQLVTQFIGESVLTILISLFMALVLVEILLPFFNDLAEMHIQMNYLANAGMLCALGGLVLLVSILGGSYPAFFLSSFNPVYVLKAQNMPNSASATLRKILVVFQFSISIILLIGTAVVYAQMHYMKTQDLGFNKDQVLSLNIPFGDPRIEERLPALKQELLQNSHIKQVAMAQQIPGEPTARLIFFVDRDGKTDEYTSSAMFVDYDMLPLLHIPVIKGRNFSRDYKTDDTAAFIINETAARQLNFSNPIGQKLSNGAGMRGYKGQVIGVVKDFHFASLHNAIEPLIIMLMPRYNKHLLARLDGADMPRTLDYIKNKYKAFDPSHPVEYTFLDETFDKLYRKEEKMLSIFGYFSLLTIFIACLGLFGLTAFMAEQRTKEIGIRKVNGASVNDIILIFVKEFMKLVGISLVIAWPISYWLMSRWLENFAYRVQLGPGIFIIAGLTVSLVALITVVYQAVSAALTNPVKALRYE